MQIQDVSKIYLINAKYQAAGAALGLGRTWAGPAAAWYFVFILYHLRIALMYIYSYMYIYIHICMYLGICLITFQLFADQ